MNKNPIAFRVISIRTTGAALPPSQSPASEHRELMAEALNYSMRSQGQILRKVTLEFLQFTCNSLTHCGVFQKKKGKKPYRSKWKTADG